MSKIEFMLNTSLMQYNFHIVQPHLFEKFIGYLFNNYYEIDLPNFKQLVLNYTGINIRNSRKVKIFYFFLHAFLLERFSFHKPLKALVKKSISDFKILSGQLIGFSSILTNRCMYSFISQYMYYTLHIEKGFTGLSTDIVQYNNFGSLNIISQNIFAFPMLFDLVDEFESIFPEYESNIGINVILSTKSVICMLIYFSHLQFPLKDFFYYKYY